MVKIHLLLLFGIFTCTGLTQCIYDKGMPPAVGSCSGPMERTVAKRDHVDFLNRGCPMYGIFSVQTDEDGKPYLQCGECIPGRSGNDRFGFLDKTSVFSAFYVSTTQQGLQQQYPIVESEVIPFSNCKPNEYCTSNGRCRGMDKSSWYYSSCKNGTCGDGLVCIGEICQICDERVSKDCVSGEITYSKYSFSLLLSQPRTVFLFILTMIAALRIVLYLPIFQITSFVVAKFTDRPLKREELALSKDDDLFLNFDDDLSEFYVKKRAPRAGELWYTQIFFTHLTHLVVHTGIEK